MNQILANQLNEDGSILLILDMQLGAEIGLDYNSWQVGKEFMGFKMINPGFHTLFYSSVNNQNEFSIRTIIPLYLRSKEVHVFQWDSKEECLVDQSSLSHDTVSKYHQLGREFHFDTKTAPYPFESIGKWMTLTNAITLDLFTCLTDASAISFVLDPTSTPHLNYTETINITQLIKQGETHTQFNTSNETSPVSKLAMLYMDASDELTKLSKSYSSNGGLSCIIGEFQFAFIQFHIGQDYESLLQWKNILFLLTASYSLITSKNDISISSFYETVMKSLILQLSELEEDFFTLVEGSMTEVVESTTIQVKKTNDTNFVIKCIESLNQIVNEAQDDIIPAVKESCMKIRNLLLSRWGILIEDIDEMPVIVMDYLCLFATKRKIVLFRCTMDSYSFSEKFHRFLSP